MPFLSFHIPNLATGNGQRPTSWIGMEVPGG